MVCYADGMKSLGILGMMLALVACGPSTSTPTTESPEPAPPGGELPEPASRDSISAADCEAQGGTVVGDIGNGAIHKPDYVCPETGVAPLGSIAPAEGEPVATEGAVCCGPADADA